MGADLRKTYLVNLDRDNIITEEWLTYCIDRAVKECGSLPEQRCRDVWGEGERFKAGLTAGGTLDQQAGLTSLDGSQQALDIPAGIYTGAQWASKEMGTFGRIGMPAILFALLRGYDEDIIGMGVQDVGHGQEAWRDGLVP